MSKSDRYAQQLGQEPERGPMPSQEEIFYPSPAPIPPRRNTGGLALKDGEVQIGALKLTGTGLQIAGNVTQEEWNKVGELLGKLEGSIQWLIGDWMAYGEDVKYGEAREIADRLNIDYGTLRNYTSISRKVDLSLRNDKLSYHHHVAVSKLPPDQQRDALAYAFEHELSVAAFRKLLNPENDTPALSDGPDFDTSFKVLRKLNQRNPSTFKPADRETARLHLLELERWMDAKRREWGID